MMKSYELLTVEEVSKLLRVSERTIYEWAQNGEIPCGKFGTAWRFRKTEILNWIDNRLKSTKKPTLNLPVKLSSLLEVERVVFLNCNSKEEALKELVTVLSTSEKVHNPDELLQQIFRREELMSTGIGMGLAIPHARLNSVDDPLLAIGICKNLIEDYQSLDNLPVNIIIMIAANSDQHAMHIKILAALTGIFKEEEIRNRILEAKSTSMIYEIITGEEE